MEWKEGVKYLWDAQGKCSANIPVSNVPVALWEEWWHECKQRYNGQRWSMIQDTYTKAQAYDVLVATMQGGAVLEQQEPEPMIEQEDKNELGLLNPRGEE